METWPAGTLEADGGVDGASERVPEQSWESSRCSSDLTPCSSFQMSLVLVALELELLVEESWN